MNEKKNDNKSNRKATIKRNVVKGDHVPITI